MHKSKWRKNILKERIYFLGNCFLKVDSINCIRHTQSLIEGFLLYSTIFLLRIVLNFLGLQLHKQHQKNHG